MFADLDDNNIGILDYNHSDDSMRFIVNNAERGRFLSGGGLDLSAGHLVLDNGYGINFGATADASGMTGEILDDYEEGTFTPTYDSGVTCSAYSAQVGRYPKSGVWFILYVWGFSQ